MRAHACGETPVPFEVGLERLGIDPLGVAAGILLRPVAEHGRPLAVEVDQFLGHHLPLL
ncbi:hypothetical protein D9M68_927790 [compost metagenome]